MLVWVQDDEEVEKIYKKECIRGFINQKQTINRTTTINPDNTMPIPINVCVCVSCDGVYPYRDNDCIIGILTDDFLTIYDSCQQFIIDFDMVKIKEKFHNSINLSQEPMKQIWKSRGLHHSILLLDGIVKFRCLFQDYDSTFTPKPEDYELLEKILFHMIRTWDTKFEKDNWNRGFN
jgi:hypothetical protein